MDSQEFTSIYNLIYEKYNQSDFSAGTDNLNPLREMTLKDVESLRTDFYIAYQEKLKEIVESQGVASLKDIDETKSDTSSDLGQPYEEKTTITIGLNLNERPSNISPDYVSSNGEFLDKSFDNLMEIEDRMLLLIGAMDSILGGDVLTKGDLPFDVCGPDSTLTDLNPGDPTPPEKGMISNVDEISDSLIDVAEKYSSHYIGSASVQIAGGPVGITFTKTKGLLCFQVQLELLGIILMILQVIRYLIMFDQMVMSVLGPIYEIIREIGAILKNPSVILNLLNKLASQGITYIMQMITEILSFLIKMLGLDCLLDGPLSIINSLVGSVLGVASAGSELSSFVNLADPENSQLAFVKQSLNFAKQVQASGPAIDKYADLTPGEVKSTIGGAFSDFVDNFANEIDSGLAYPTLNIITGAGEKVTDDWNQLRNVSVDNWDRMKVTAKKVPEAASTLWSGINEDRKGALDGGQPMSSTSKYLEQLEKLLVSKLGGGAKDVISQLKDSFKDGYESL
jgi:hypothetical protein